MLMEIAFDDKVIAAELESLSTPVLQRLFDFVRSDGQGMPLDIFLSEFVPAGVAGNSNQVIYGLRLSARAKSLVAA
jgi:hypothetical protein